MMVYYRRPGLMWLEEKKKQSHSVHVQGAQLPSNGRT